MKNLMILFAAVLLTGMMSCTKDPDTTQDTQTHDTMMVDWASGRIIPIYFGEEAKEAASRSSNTYFHHMGYSTGKFGYKIDIYQGNTQVFAGDWTWDNLSGTSIAVAFEGDNELAYVYRVHYSRKILSVPVGLAINWSSDCHALGEGEWVDIPVEGATRTHTFQACQ